MNNTNNQKNNTVTIVSKTSQHQQVPISGASIQQPSHSPITAPTSSLSPAINPVPPYVNVNTIAQGDIVRFGQYSWRVLETWSKGGSKEALLLSENVIELCKHEHKINVKTSWADCELRLYLNGDFYNSFTQEEKSQIMEKQIATQNNGLIYKGGLEYTTDKIFLLSIADVLAYFGDSGKLPKVLKRSPYKFSLFNSYLSDKYNSDRIAKDAEGNTTSWWLRSPSTSIDSAAINVYPDGTVSVHGDRFVSERTRNSWTIPAGGIRPALWLDLQYSSPSTVSHKQTQMQQIPSTRQSTLDVVHELKPKNITHRVGNIMRFGSFEWRILEIQGDRALLLSDKVVERRKYHDRHEAITWADCTLRQYLNGSFLNSFNEAEKFRIIDTSIVNWEHPSYGTGGGEDTIDKIFMLSIDEVVNYFDDNSKLAMEFIERYGTFVEKACVAHDVNGAASWWWLRSPGEISFAKPLGEISKTTSVISPDGTLRSCDAITSNIDVRPALWLNL